MQVYEELIPKSSKSKILAKLVLKIWSYWETFC